MDQEPNCKTWHENPEKVDTVQLSLPAHLPVYRSLMFLFLTYWRYCNFAYIRSTLTNFLRLRDAEKEKALTRGFPKDT
jgi:hypothetical protein